MCKEVDELLLPRNMKRSLNIIFFLTGFSLCSQNYVDILKLQMNTTPLTGFDSGSAKTRVNELVADLTVPLKIDDQLSFLTGATYENIQVKLFPESKDENFGSAALKLGLNKQMTEKWSATCMLLPKIASDFVVVNKKDIQIGGAAIFKYKKRDNLNYKFGLYYNSDLFGPFFVPMAGFYYLGPNKKLEANVMLPLQADVNYKVHPTLNVGMNFNGQIRSYHLTNVNGYQNVYLTRSTNEIYLYLKFNFSKSFSIQTKIGQSIARNYRVYDEKDKVNFALPATFIGHKRKQLNTDLSDSVIFQVVLLYRFNLDKK
jgi:hypothetical protein